MRLIQVPDNESITYNEENKLFFPVGTFLIKTFYYLNDARKLKGEHRLIETRLLKKTSSYWVALPYIWKEDQTDAVLALAGGSKDVSWICGDGKPVNILIVYKT